jgi:hypothetical protein
VRWLVRRSWDLAEGGILEDRAVESGPKNRFFRLPSSRIAGIADDLARKLLLDSDLGVGFPGRNEAPWNGVL